MAKTSEKYEVMYIINPNLSEEETAAIVERFKTLVEQNGTLDEMEEMGKRKLAYEINYLSEGYYVLIKFTSAPEFPAELDRILGITDGVIRSHHHPQAGVRGRRDAQPHRPDGTAHAGPGTALHAVADTRGEHPHRR